MYELFIKNYIEKLTKNDFNQLATEQNIFLNNQELDIIYYYLKKDWLVFYKGDPTNIINEIKGKITPDNFNKGLELYNQYKNKLL